MLTGDSGILSNAEKAKEQTNLANSKEQVALAVTVALTEGLGTVTKANLVAELDKLLGVGEENYTITPNDEVGPWTITVTATGYSTTINSTGKTTDVQGEGGNTGGTGTLPTGNGTTPWLPSAKFSQVTGTTLETGLVIANTTDGTPGTKNYVWIEVPTTISGSVIRNGTATTVTLEDAKTDSEIYTILEAYAGDYIKGKSNQDYGSWKEEWFDKYNATWDGTSTYAYITNKSSDNFSERILACAI